MIYCTSDTHFCHNRRFIFEPRGFKTIDEHDEAIIQRWNSVVSNEDIVYHLGDVMLGGPDCKKGIEYLKRLNGKIHIIRGNHCTDNRCVSYLECENVVEVVDAKYLHYKKYHFFMTHYPCFSGNLHHDSLKKTTCNLFGHTHSKEKFYQDIPFMYNVAVDAHNCAPVSLDKIIEEMEEKVEECKEFL